MVGFVIRLSTFSAVIFILLGHGESSRTSDKIYFTIKDVQGCFRRLNATHQIGCSSKMGGNIGVVHLIETEMDLEWIIEYGPHAPYIPIMSSVTFNMTNVKRLKDSGKISGILVSHVLANDSITSIPPEGFSPAHSCPSDAFGLYNNNSEYGHCKPVTWNPVGSSLMFEDLDIPIFVIRNVTELDYLINGCYEKFNRPNPNGTARSYPLCAAELKAPMYAAKDSVTCIRRTNHIANLNVDKFCDPLGDYNVFATFKEITSKQRRLNNSVILAAARLDSYSLFDHVTPSADNDVTGFIALLAAAQALSESGAKKIIKESPSAKDILFTFFQGEAFDYIGSSRMVYEMEKNRFPHEIKKDDKSLYLHPINLSDISHMVEVNQLGYDNVWLHTDPLSRNNSAINQEVKKMLDNLKSFSSEFNINVTAVGENQPLPPASVQRFLMKRSIPSVVLTDHQREFTNRYYNSRFDLSGNINADYPPSVVESERYDYVTKQAASLSKRAGLLANFLFSLSTGQKADFITVDPTLVTHLLYCFLYDGKCDLFRTVVDKEDEKSLESTPFPFYVSVDGHKNHVTGLTQKLLAYFIGDEMVNITNSDSCKDKDKLYQYLWMQGPVKGNSSERPGVCYRSTATFSEAKSPVFLEELEGYDWVSGEYSTWTESTWEVFSVRIFLVPSKQFQAGILGIGVAILLVSHCLVYLLARKADLLFTTPPSFTPDQPPS